MQPAPEQCCITRFFFFFFAEEQGQLAGRNQTVNMTPVLYSSSLIQSVFESQGTITN